MIPQGIIRSHAAVSMPWEAVTTLQFAHMDSALCALHSYADDMQDWRRRSIGPTLMGISAAGFCSTREQLIAVTRADLAPVFLLRLWAMFVKCGPKEEVVALCGHVRNLLETVGEPLQEVAYLNLAWQCVAQCLAVKGVYTADRGVRPYASMDHAEVLAVLSTAEAVGATLECAARQLGHRHYSKTYLLETAVQCGGSSVPGDDAVHENGFVHVDGIVHGVYMGLVLSAMEPSMADTLQAQDALTCGHAMCGLTVGPLVTSGEDQALIQWIVKAMDLVVNQVDDMLTARDLGAPIPDPAYIGRITAPVLTRAMCSLAVVPTSHTQWSTFACEDMELPDMLILGMVHGVVSVTPGTLMVVCRWAPYMSDPELLARTLQDKAGHATVDSDFDRSLQEALDCLQTRERLLDGSL